MAPPAVYSPFVPPRSVLIMGQSNAIGGTGADDVTWGGQSVQSGATVRWNGTNITEYPSVCGPVPYVVQEMLDAGVVAPIVAVEAQSGMSIDGINVSKIPAAISDFVALGIDGWDAIWLWQGEREADVEADAIAYSGPTKLPRFFDLCWNSWPGSPIFIQELLSEDAVKCTYHAELRAAQLIVLGLYPDGTFVPSLTPSALPTYDGVHATPDAGGGYAQAAERMWTAVAP